MTWLGAALLLPLLFQLLPPLSIAADDPAWLAAAHLQLNLQTSVESAQQLMQSLVVKEPQEPLMNEMTRIRLRLDNLEKLLPQAVATLLSLNITCHPTDHLPKPKPEPEPEPKPKCEAQLSPLPAAAAPHQKPAVPACAATCLQLRDQGGATEDGVYWLAGLPVPVYCDLSLDGGGWTLLVTATSVDSWDALTVSSRSQLSPSLEDNYSILRHADTVRDLGSGVRFAYRIEAQAERGRQRWGGVWLAPRRYSFLHETNSQTGVHLVRKFNNWSYHTQGIEQRMPWWNTGVFANPALLTTTGDVAHWWGTLVTDKSTTTYTHSPWIYHSEATQSGKVLYWMREEVY